MRLWWDGGALMGLLVRLWHSLGRSSAGDPSPSEPFAYRGWKWLWQRLPSKSPRVDLFDRLESTDWDVLLILDACRADVLADVATSAVVDTVVSPASSTPEFLDAAHRRGVFDDTVYVSANPQTDDRSPGSDLTLVPVHDDGWNDSLNTVPATNVFERVRAHLDASDPVVGHLMQPHYPHICDIDGRTQPVPNGLHPEAFSNEWLADQTLQAVLASGAFDLGRARRSYEASVEYAWRKASAFASELAAGGMRVVITADHGELFGERGFVEHPVGVRIGPLVRVPWVVFEPVSGVERERAPGEQLTALGYRE